MATFYKCNKCNYVSPHDKRCAFCGAEDKSRYSVKETVRDKKRRAISRIKGSGLQMNIGLGGVAQVAESSAKNKKTKYQKVKELRRRGRSSNMRRIRS